MFPSPINSSGKKAAEIERYKRQAEEGKSEVSKLQGEESASKSEQASASDQKSTIESSMSCAKSAVSDAKSNLSSANDAVSAANAIEGEEIIDEETGEVIGIDYSARDAAVAQAEAQVAEAQTALDNANAELEREQQSYQDMLFRIEELESKLETIRQDAYFEEQNVSEAENKVKELEAEQKAIEPDEPTSSDKPLSPEPVPSSHNPWGNDSTNPYFKRELENFFKIAADEVVDNLPVSDTSYSDNEELIDSIESIARERTALINSVNDNEKSSSSSPSMIGENEITFDILGDSKQEIVYELQRNRKIETEDELFSFLGVDSNREFNDVQTSKRAEIFNMYDLGVLNLEEACEKARALRDDLNKSNEYFKLPKFKEMVSECFGIALDDSELDKVVDYGLISIGSLDYVHSLYQEQNNQIMMYDLVQRCCSENSLSKPDNFTYFQKKLEGISPEKYDSIYSNSSENYATNINDSGLALKETLKQLGCDSQPTIITDENGQTTIELKFENEDGSITTVDAIYQDGQIIEKTQSKQLLDGSFEETKTKFNSDGSYNIVDMDGDVVKTSSDIALEELTKIVDSNGSEVEYSDKNLGSSEFTASIAKANTFEDMYKQICHYTNGDEATAKMILNGMFKDSSFKQALGGKNIELTQDNKLSVDGISYGLENQENPFNDKENLVVNSMFEYRNGSFVLSESLLSEFTANSIKTDDKGNISSVTEYYIDNNGQLAKTQTDYTYDESGLVSEMSVVDFDSKTGEISFREEAIVLRENGSTFVHTTRYDNQDNIVYTNELLEEDYNELTSLQATARKYTDRIDLTYDELQYCDTIDYLTKNNATIKEILLNRDYEDGIFSKGWNWFKETTTLGVGRNEISNPLVDRNNSINSLISTFNIDGKTFEEAYSEEYGVEYNQDSIDLTRLIEGTLLLYSTGEYSNNVEGEEDKTYSNLLQMYIDSSNSAFGTSSQLDLSELVASYVDSQEAAMEVADKIATGAQVAGTVLIIGGSVIAFTATGAGAAAVAGYAISAGNTMALSSILGNDVVKLAEESTSKNSSDEQMDHLLKQTASHIALNVAGRGIGKLTNQLNGLVSENTTSLLKRVINVDSTNKLGIVAKLGRVAGTISEIGIDASASLLVESLVTGQCDVKGEAFSQVLSFVTGLSSQKINGLMQKYPNSKDMDFVEALKLMFDETKYNIGKDVKFLSGVTSSSKLVSAFEGEYGASCAVDKHETVAYIMNDPIYTDKQRKAVTDFVEHLTELGYRDFIEQNPSVLRKMVNCSIAGYSYDGLNANQMELIKYAFEQGQNGEISDEVIKAVARRINSSTNPVLFDYVDKIDTIPQEGLNVLGGYTYNKNTCTRIINEEIIPLRDFLKTQNTPVSVDVNRVDSSMIFNSIELNGKSLGSLMSSGDAKSINEVLAFFNSGESSYTFNNFVGTSFASNTGNIPLFGGDTSILWHIDLPKGSEALFLNGIHKGEGIWSEAEVLLQMGTTLDIKNARYVAGTWEIDAVAKTPNSIVGSQSSVTPTQGQLSALNLQQILNISPSKSILGSFDKLKQITDSLKSYTSQGEAVKIAPDDFTKGTYGYQYFDSKPLEDFSGIITEEMRASALSTPRYYGGTYLKGSIDRVLSTQDVHNCSYINMVNTKTGTQSIYHVMANTSEKTIMKEMEAIMPEGFDKVTIVPGDQVGTDKTTASLYNVVKSVNGNADVSFAHFNSSIPVIVSYNGKVYQMDNTTLNKTLFNVPEHDFLYLIQGLEAKKAKANKVKIK